MTYPTRITNVTVTGICDVDGCGYPDAILRGVLVEPGGGTLYSHAECAGCDRREAALMVWTVTAQAARRAAAPPITVERPAPVPLPSQPWLNQTARALYQKITGRTAA